ncbi:thiol reductant ABC exporter subunit CydC [Natronospirillum operosum]|uniref:Thiol reductant ABC exporter subunit CydC n=1 Tax=Natronospirillum operosum TaxID=2759953 RepID=A0A4Z0W807_9GAMM|nr:thiol reductant ABC exporter subunit CydC [Natronospirillum operosum]TGG94194.1 thiol reductant ABC exporter subunit CydC [Natronospirillum operosum]
MKRSDHSILAPWLKLILQQQRRLWIGAALMLLTVASAIGLLAVSGWFITATALTGLLLAAGVAATLDIYVPGGAIRAFALSRTVARYLERLYNHDTVLRLLAELRTAAFARLTRLDGTRLGRLRAAEWLNRLTADIDTLDNLYLRLLAPPLVTAAGIALVAGLIMIFLPATGLIIGLGLSCLLLALTWGLARRSRAASAELSARLEQLRVTSIEQLQGLSELTAYGMLERHQVEQQRHEQLLQQRQHQVARQIACANGLATVGVQSAVVLSLIAALLAFNAGQITGPVAVMLPLAVMALGEAFALLPKAFGHWGATVAAAARLNEDTAVPEAGPAATVSVPDRPHIRLQQVSLHYPVNPHLPALQAFDLELPFGAQVGLIGPSGSGKSTVAQLLVGLLQPTAGQITVNDTDLSALAEAQWLARIGYLTQQTDLFNESVASNLLLACPQASDADLWAALHQVGLDTLVQELPRQLDTPVGETGRQFSGGEARRLALARLLLKDPAIVVLDEPFSGLDRFTADGIRQVLAAWLPGKTLLALGHDETALPTVDRIVHLSS